MLLDLLSDLFGRPCHDCRRPHFPERHDCDPCGRHHQRHDGRHDHHDHHDRHDRRCDRCGRRDHGRRDGFYY